MHMIHLLALQIIVHITVRVLGFMILYIDIDIYANYMYNTCSLVTCE